MKSKKSAKLQNHQAYIEQFPLQVQQILMQIRETIKKVAPQAEETIRYGMPAFRINQQHLYFAAYKHHIGLYPMYGMEELEEELAGYRGKDTKDAIHFSYTKPLPLELIEKIVVVKSRQS